MKRIIALLSAIFILMSLTSCSENSNGEVYKLGDTVSTDIFEFKLNAAEFTIALSSANDESYFTPKEYEPEADKNNPYIAPTGATWMAFSYTVKNLDRADKTFHKGSFATVKYNGKTYGRITGAFKEGAYFSYENKNIFYPNNEVVSIKAGNWYTEPSQYMQLSVGGMETRRAYIIMDTDVESLNDDVMLTVKIPNSAGKTVKFTYIITESDRMTYTNSETEAIN